MCVCVCVCVCVFIHYVSTNSFYFCLFHTFSKIKPVALISQY